MNCITCGAGIPAERLRLLPQTRKCVRCSDAQPYKGMVHYGHKTGGSVQPMMPDTFAAMRKYTSRKGKRSNMGSFFARA